MHATKESAHGWQANGREDAATRQHPTIEIHNQQCAAPRNCSACGKPTSKPGAFTLFHPWGGSHQVVLCPACKRGLDDRANDPLLIAVHDGEAFAGGIVRRIWRRIAAAQGTGMPNRPVAMLEGDANEEGGI